MKKTNTGGPAFPCDRIQAGNHVVCSDGISTRDYFAAKAMQGLLANPKLSETILKHGGAHGGWIEDSAWAFADSMLKVREE
jgi:hypothetical protein